MWAIPIAGIACAAYLIGLACFLARFFAMELPIVAALVAGEKMDWHVWFILALAMVILAAVPLTLAHAIVRMISSEKSDSDDGAKVVTPQLELAKVLSGLLASVLKR